MESIANIIPKALRRGQIGHMIREQEELDVFKLVLDHILPGDLRHSVRGLYIQGSLLTAASLSGSANIILKEKQAEMLTLMRQFEPRTRIKKIRILT